MKIRLALSALALVATMMSGCSGQPTPEPSTPSFASQDEAFAAAEQTYRNYVDALNQVDLSDPATFEDVYQWTTGEANAGERKSLSGMHADGWTVSGATSIVSVAAIPSDSEGMAAIEVCIDVSGVDVKDASGVSQVSPDRPAQQSQVVSFQHDTTSQTGLLVSAIEGGSKQC